MLNKVILMGRLTRDPELRHTQSGTAVTSFTLAVNRDFKREGDPQADFFDIVCWDKKAEFSARYFAKGKLVVVTGRLQQRSWTDNDNNRRTVIEVVAEDLHFVESKRDTSNAPPAAPPPLPPAQNDYGFHELEDDDGELPF